MNNIELLDKALAQLRALNIGDALDIFYRILETQPDDLELIARIYPLEIRKKKHDGYLKICRHIFSIGSKTHKIHELFCLTWRDFKERFKDPIDIKDYSHQAIFNLFYHLGQTSYTKDCDIFKDYIKREMAENQQTPQALFCYCEQLISQKKFRLAEKELEFLMIYYAESETTIPAEKLIKKVRQRFLK